MPVSLHAVESAPAASHNDLFVSGAYAGEFRPDDAANPFRADYEAKRAWVVDTVTGRYQHVLDAGGAMGRMAIPLSQRHEVTLCDLSAKMLRIARRDADPRLRLAVADVRALPFADGHFDWALCIDVLPHLTSPVAALQEIRRVLKPRGRLIVDSTNAIPLWTFAYPRYLGRRPQRWLDIWRSGGVLPEWKARVHHLRFNQFVSVVREAGFHIRSRRDFGPAICPKWHVVVAEAA